MKPVPISGSDIFVSSLQCVWLFFSHCITVHLIYGFNVFGMHHVLPGYIREFFLFTKTQKVEVRLVYIAYVDAASRGHPNKLRYLVCKTPKAGFTFLYFL